MIGPSRRLLGPCPTRAWPCHRGSGATRYLHPCVRRVRVEWTFCNHPTPVRSTCIRGDDRADSVKPGLCGDGEAPGQPCPLPRSPASTLRDSSLLLHESGERRQRPALASVPGRSRQRNSNLLALRGTPRPESCYHSPVTADGGGIVRSVEAATRASSRYSSSHLGKGRPPALPPGLPDRKRRRGVAGGRPPDPYYRPKGSLGPWTRCAIMPRDRDLLARAALS